MKHQRYTITLVLDAYEDDPDVIRRRISQCLATHPRLSLRVETVEVSKVHTDVVPPPPS